jgi:hypothetical protein
MIMTKTGQPLSEWENHPLETWGASNQDILARTIRRHTGLDAQTCNEIARDAAENGEAKFMTATVLIIGTEDITETQHPVSGRRGLARWRAYGGSIWYLALMARDT